MQPESQGTDETIAQGRYALIDCLGSGGMAEVWRARDTQLDVERAIKILRDADKVKRVRLTRFLNEAKAMARIDHPHVVRVHDVGQDPRGPYIVMELVSGGSLAELAHREGSLDPRRAVTLACQMLDGLQAAHQHGIVHRDVKPANVLLDSFERAKLADFGVARLTGLEHSPTHTGARLGSPHYMAPEQRQDAKSVGPPADLYAVATVLYELVTGASPVDLFTAPADSPRWHDVPEPLRPILQCATALNPEHRYGSAVAMATALASAREALPEAPPARPATDTAPAIEPLPDDPTDQDAPAPSLAMPRPRQATDPHISPPPGSRPPDSPVHVGFAPTPAMAQTPSPTQAPAPSPTPPPTAPTIDRPPTADTLDTPLGDEAGDEAFPMKAAVMGTGLGLAVATAVALIIAAVMWLSPAQAGSPLVGTWQAQGDGYTLELVLEGNNHTLGGTMKAVYPTGPAETWKVAGTYNPSGRLLFLEEDSYSADPLDFRYRLDDDGQTLRPLRSWYWSHNGADQTMNLTKSWY